MRKNVEVYVYWRKEVEGEYERMELRKVKRKNRNEREE